MCKVCRENIDIYCKRHQIAYDNLVKGYQDWKKATDISWEDYLKEVVKNKFTGEWVLEVAQQLINKKEKM